MVQNNKIAFVIHGLGMGGAEKFLITNMNNFYNNGYQPVLILLSEKKGLVSELNSNIRVVTILKKSRYDLSISNRIKKFIKQEGINKVFCVNTYPFFLTKLAFLFDRQTRFFISLHSTIPISKKIYWHNLLYFRFLTKGDKIIYVCNNQKNYLEKKYHVSPKYGMVVYNGIDTAYFNPELFKDLNTKSLREQYGLSESDSIIVKVARIYTEKDHFTAVDALFDLHNEHNNKAHLLLVGNGEDSYMQSLKNHVKDKGLEQHIHFAGNQSDVRKFYCVSDIFTLTSYTETFSLAALEAMAFGLPCSLTDIGGASEMIIENKTGLLSKPKSSKSIADTWNRLLQKNLKGPDIRNFVLENFSATKMLQTYLDILG